MKITARAVQASLTITDEAGNTVAEYSVENMSFVTDISGLLRCVSQAAHVFKALDAEHNVAQHVPAQPVQQPARSTRIGTLERSPQVQELIDAVRRFKSRTSGVGVDLTTEQHDGYMALADALHNACDDASAGYVAVLAERAREYAGMFTDDKYVVVRNRLLAAVAAV